ncbi:PH domain-containing protein [Streptomyces sp. NBC_01275]|uniref:PH domain-containing protein n=1 Tax=Streptomyces sp. NBC_01275 TaxID=2903807 RepID=UPI00225C3BFD|nr:PH domain-containing protein [Streptomyces sp. NBC_01275]MCX4763010.1 PH domain-containing protein [Streptomyces sp. NBC_01275]
MNDGIEREYRRRRAVPAAYVTLAAVTVVIAMKVLSTTTLSGPTAWDALILALWLSIGGRVVLEQWRARTSVTAAGITVRGLLRTRTWAWSDVYDIRVEGSKRGSLRRPAYLYGSDGRRVLLPHLDEHQLDDPIGEVADLRATAAGAGLMSLETRPETEERITRGARRRTAVNRAAVATLVVVVAMFVLDTWMIFTDRPTQSVLLIACVPLLCLPVFFLLLDRLGEVLAARRSPTHP